MARHRGRLLVYYEDIRQALGLPEETTILGFCDSRRFGAVEIKVAHPDMPLVEEGMVIPVVHATFEDGKLVDWDS